MWLRVVTRPVTLGSSPSRPGLKMIRACELVAAMRLGADRGEAGDVGQEGEEARDALRGVHHRDAGRRERHRAVVEPHHGGIGQEHVQHRDQRDAREHRPRHRAPRILRLLGHRGRVLPADEQVDGQREPERQTRETTVQVPGVEGFQADAARVLDEQRLRHHDEQHQLEPEEQRGNVGRWLRAPTIRYSAPSVSTSVRICHGMSMLRYLLMIVSVQPPEMQTTEATAMMWPAPSTTAATTAE